MDSLFFFPVKEKLAGNDKNQSKQRAQDDTEQCCEEFRKTEDFNEKKNKMVQYN